MLSEATACAPGNARVVSRKANKSLRDHDGSLLRRQPGACVIFIEALLMKRRLLVSPAFVTGTMQVLIHVHTLSYSKICICAGTVY